MTEEYRLYLDYARRDLQAAEGNPNLGFYHITISRGYYAMFYAASALLASQGIVRSKHSGVLSAFGGQFVRTGLIEPEYANMLGHAFDSRLDSDYDVTYINCCTKGRETPIPPPGDELSYYLLRASRASALALLP